MKRFNILLLIFFILGSLTSLAQPKVKLKFEITKEYFPIDQSLNYTPFSVVFRNNKASFWYKGKEYIKPTFDWASKPILYDTEINREKHTSVFKHHNIWCSFVMSHGKWYILNLDSGEYIPISGETEFLSQPLKHSDTYIYETSYGTFINDKGGSAPIKIQKVEEAKNLTFAKYIDNNIVAFYKTSYSEETIKSQIVLGNCNCYYDFEEYKVLKSNIAPGIHLCSRGNFDYLVSESADVIEFFMDAIHIDDTYLLPVTESQYKTYLDGKPLIFTLNAQPAQPQKWLEIIDCLKSLHVKYGSEASDIKINPNADFYTYRISDKHIISRITDKTIIYKGSSAATFTIRDKIDLIDINDQSKFGLVRMSDNICILPTEKVKIGTIRKRHTSDKGIDFIIQGDTISTIRSYEEDLYSHIRTYCTMPVQNIVYSVLTKRCNEYLNDRLLKEREKTHLAEVKELSKNFSQNFDYELFQTLSNQEYIATPNIPADMKKYLKCAEAGYTKLFKGEYKPSQKNHHSSERVYSEEVEPYLGNFYIHKIYTYKDLIFRENAITKNTELVLYNSDKTYYFDLGSTNNVNTSQYDRIDCIVTSRNEILLLYNEMRRNYRTDITISAISIDCVGNIERIREVAYRTSDITVKSGFFYTSSFVVRKRSYNSYSDSYTDSDLYSYNWDITPVNGSLSNEEQRKLQTMVKIYDPTLDSHLEYVSERGEFLYDVLKWGDKWVITGSTINSGYIDWENPYIIVLNDNLDVVSKSHIPLKGERLRVTESDVTKSSTSLQINGWLKIDKDNNIEWLKPIN